MRFDFTCPKAMTVAQVKEAEVVRTVTTVVNRVTSDRCKDFLNIFAEKFSK
jgi:hypothetical protein